MTACAVSVLPDAWSRFLIEGLAARLLRPFPLALGHLRHYLAGSGQSRWVSTAAWFRADAGLRSALAQELQVDPAPGGRLAVSQSVLTNWEWRLAIGSVQVDWERDADGIWISFADRYDWHPDAPRVTRILHRAAAHLRGSGARAFTVHGRRERVRLPASEPARRRLPLGRLYL